MDDLPAPRYITAQHPSQNHRPTPQSAQSKLYPSNESFHANIMIFDTLILGAGPAGLSAALGLARQLYSVVVFDSQRYRNHPASHMHNVLTWDHKSPVDFRESAKANLLARYDSVVFRDSRIDEIAKLEDGTFEVTDGLGAKTLGRKIVLATGVEDVMLDVEGFAELWGRSMYVISFLPAHAVPLHWIVANG